MAKPQIYAIDDDPQVLGTISRDLRSRYGDRYKIISTTSASEALDQLAELKNIAGAVALFVCDQRMPDMDGVAFLSKALQLFPRARRVLLTAYSDTEAAIRAINIVQLDHYLIKPWDPPEENLYPVLDDLLDDWQSSFIPEFTGIRLIGHQYSSDSHQIKDFLASNLTPFKWLDIATNPEAAELLELNGLSEEHLPVVLFEDGALVSRPDIRTVAEKTGGARQVSHVIYDVTIIGAGPAGLSAAVYGASEGLKTLLIEKKAPGGQAGMSSRIENYLGFPAGVSGADLTRRAISQAIRLGAEIYAPHTVSSIRLKNNYKILTLNNGSEIVSRSVVIATGVDYRRLETKGAAALTGSGIYYGAATTEAAACAGQEVYIVGGANSAGQSAVFLSGYAKAVYLVIRRDSLAATMSAYLIRQIESISNITVLAQTEITEASGKGRLQRLTLYDVVSGRSVVREAGALYVFIGAKPFTDWLDDTILRNERGFIQTGPDLKRNRSRRPGWKNDRDPFLLETSIPGIFAAGDVRAGAMNRITSAVGEGSAAISMVHQYLSEI